MYGCYLNKLCFLLCCFRVFCRYWRKKDVYITTNQTYAEPNLNPNHKPYYWTACSSKHSTKYVIRIRRNSYETMLLHRFYYFLLSLSLCNYATLKNQQITHNLLKGWSLSVCCWWQLCYIIWIKTYIFLSPTSTNLQSLNIVLSKAWLQRRLIGVKGVEEGDRISSLEGYLQPLK